MSVRDPPPKDSFAPIANMGLMFCPTDSFPEERETFSQARTRQSAVLLLRSQLWAKNGCRRGHGCENSQKNPLALKSAGIQDRVPKKKFGALHPTLGRSYLHNNA